MISILSPWLRPHVLIYMCFLNVFLKWQYLMDNSTIAPLHHCTIDGRTTLGPEQYEVQ